MEQTIKTELKNEFVKLSDLTKQDVDKGLKNGDFIKIPLVFKRNFNKRGKENVSITATIVKPQIEQLILTNGSSYISSAFFHNILTLAKASYKDAKGYDINEWKLNALARFVKGEYSNRDGEYHSLEVVFKQGKYIIHFFDYDQYDLIKSLEDQKIFNPKWLTRPDKIEAIEFTSEIDF